MLNRKQRNSMHEKDLAKWPRRCKGDKAIGVRTDVAVERTMLRRQGALASQVKA